MGLRTKGGCRRNSLQWVQTELAAVLTHERRFSLHHVAHHVVLRESDSVAPCAGHVANIQAVAQPSTALAAEQGRVLVGLASCRSRLESTSQKRGLCLPKGPDMRRSPPSLPRPPLPLICTVGCIRECDVLDTRQQSPRPQRDVIVSLHYTL